MFTPTLRCECAQPGLIDTMRKWFIKVYSNLCHSGFMKLIAQKCAFYAIAWQTAAVSLTYDLKNHKNANVASSSDMVPHFLDLISYSALTHCIIFS